MQACFSAPATSRTGLSWLRRSGQWPCTAVVALLWTTTALAQDGTTRAAFRDDGALLVDGKAVFPVGARCERLASVAQIAQARFNLVLGSGEWKREHYDDASTRGLLILAGHHSWLTFRGVPDGIDLKVREETLLKHVARAARDQSQRTIHETLAEFDALPGVIGWCISDEPEAKLSEVAEAGYELFKSNSPGHVVSQISCDPHWFKNFRHAADVLIVDHYPFQRTTARRNG